MTSENNMKKYNSSNLVVLSLQADSTKLQIGFQSLLAKKKKICNISSKK